MGGEVEMEGRRLTLGDLLPVLSNNTLYRIQERDGKIGMKNLYTTLFTAYGTSSTLSLYKDRPIDSIRKSDDGKCIVIEIDSE